MTVGGMENWVEGVCLHSDMLVATECPSDQGDFGGRECLDNLSDILRRQGLRVS